MRKLDRRRLERLIDDFAGVRLLVVGDLVLDEYVWGEVDRVSPEAPVPVVHVRAETVMLGGAANAARNVVALGGSVECCSVIGDDAAGHRVEELMKDLGVDPGGLVRVAGRPTTRKTRIIARSQQVVRFDRETFEPPPATAGRALLQAITRVLPGVDGVVVEDYGKGVLSRRIARSAMQLFTEAGVPVAVDPKADLSHYRGASLVKPNLKEAEELAGIRARSEEDLRRIATRLRRRIGGAAVVVTRGQHGMSIFEEEGGPVLHVPTVAREVFDVQGAGDTAIAALTLALRAGGTLHEAAVIANAASGVVVGKVGTATATADEVKAILPEALAAARGAA
jgi:D-beta-D-heptose 7-phosphate kinase/D-beta-D-heptose 1-phosphate adenosyltransferase